MNGSCIGNTFPVGMPHATRQTEKTLAVYFGLARELPRHYSCASYCPTNFSVALWRTSVKFDLFKKGQKV